MTLQHRRLAWAVHGETLVAAVAADTVLADGALRDLADGGRGGACVELGVDVGPRN